MDFPWSPAPRLLGGRFCFLAVAPLRFARPAHRLRGNPVCRCVIRSARSFSSVSELPTLPQATKSFPHSFPIDGKAMHRYPVFARTPGDGLDGYRVEMVVRPSHWLKHMPRDWSFAEALKRPSYPRPCFDRLACPRCRGAAKSWPGRIGAWYRRCLGFRTSIGQMGARVIVTSSSDEKLERARALGADFGVNCRRNENWCEAVLELTKVGGVSLSLKPAVPAVYRNP